MLTKKLLTISLLLPLMVASVSAYAGSTITDKNYWPSEARQSAQGRPAVPQGNVNSAFAYDRAPASLQSATNPNDAGATWRYQGGPKSR
jgi:hypothetical protein